MAKLPRFNYGRSSYPSGWSSFFGRPIQETGAGASSAGASAAAASSGWRSSYQRMTPTERLGLNLLARAFGGSRLNLLASILQAIPGLSPQRLDVPTSELPGPVRRRAAVRPPSLGSKRGIRWGEPSAGGRGGRPPGGRFSPGMGEDPEDIPFGEIVEDDEIPLGEVVRQPPRHTTEDGVINQNPSFGRIAPPTREEQDRRRAAGEKATDGAIYAGRFGTVDLFRPKAPSSNVFAVGYDDDEMALFIQFMPTVLENGIAKKRQPTSATKGPVYRYNRVPRDVFTAILNAGSPGKKVWDRVRVRGSRYAHQYTYSLAMEGSTLNRRREEVEYVPRRATREGLAPREYRGVDGRMRRNTLPTRDRRG